MYERVTKSAAKWKKWWLKRKGCQRVPHFARNNYALNQKDWIPGKNVAIIGNSYCFGLSLRYKNGMQFCSRIWKGYYLGKISILKGKGFKPPGGASPYKTLLSSPPHPLHGRLPKHHEGQKQKNVEPMLSFYRSILSYEVSYRSRYSCTLSTH